METQEWFEQFTARKVEESIQKGLPKAVQQVLPKVVEEGVQKALPKAVEEARQQFRWHGAQSFRQLALERAIGYKGTYPHSDRDARPAPRKRSTILREPRYVTVSQ